MTQQKISQQWWHPLVKNLASKGPVIWILAHTLQHLDRFTYRVSGGKHTAATILTGLPVVTLTTSGAKSGKPRSVPLVGIPYGDNLVFIASNWGQPANPSWYYNLSANPEAVILFQGQSNQYIAHESTGSEREVYWKLAVDTYAGYAAYESHAKGRQIPIMVCVPMKNLPSNDSLDG